LHTSTTNLAAQTRANLKSHNTIRFLVSPDFRPPNKPWTPLKQGESKLAALSFYYSDPHSEIPVREITKENDNKADPNLETKTYGLFSTCERAMRARAVADGFDHILFCTRREGTRVLTGYYELGWYCKMPPVKGYSKKSVLPDYALSARRVHFIIKGFPLDELTGYLDGTQLGSRFRTFRYIDKGTADKLVRLLNEIPDETRGFLTETRRLEATNIAKWGYAYRNWKRTKGFDWSVATKYLGAGSA